jgi:cytochrome bd-type quinol oxidase subunit 2
MINKKRLVNRYGLIFASLVACAMFIVATPAFAQSIPTEESVRSYNCKNQTSGECLKENPIIKWLNIIINALAAIIGIAATIMIVVGGLQYASARDNPQAVQAAQERIRNVLIGLLTFIFFYAFIQWLIPGGVF